MATSLLDLRLYVLGVGTAAIALFILKVMRAFHERKLARQNGCQLPLHSVSHGFFGIGMVMAMLKAGRQKCLLELIRSWHRIYGTTFKARMVGRNVFFTVEPRNVQTVLALNFQDFELGAIRTKALRPLLGHGIFSTDGSEWERSRALLRPSFGRNRITDTMIYERHVTKLVRLIPYDGSTVDLQDLFFRMTLDSATEFLFGESVHSLDEATSPSASSFANDFSIALEGLAERNRLGTLMMLHKDNKFSKAVVNARSYVAKFVEKAIEYRMQVDKSEEINNDNYPSEQHNYLFLHELSKQTLDKTELTDQLLSILLAGRDTTASLLSVTFFILARRSDIWNKLREQVTALGYRRPSFEDSKSMNYMTWVLNESLRMYPVVPLNVRMANKHTTLPVGGGPDGKAPLFVPKGHEVMYSVYGMHRLAQFYGSDAEEYRPERWETIRPGWAYAPFNGGPRVCLGQQFALTEAAYTVTRVLQQFEAIESRDPRPFEEALSLSMASANGTQVALTPSTGH